MEPAIHDEPGNEETGVLINELPIDSDSDVDSKAIKWKQILLKVRNVGLLVLTTQVLSLTICGSAVFTQILKNWFRFQASVTQLFLVYCLLAFVFGAILAARDNFVTTLKRHWWKYLILGLIDVEANYMVVQSQKYTTLTSVQLLDSFALFSVLVLSFLFLRTRYFLVHGVGVVICLGGMILLLVADIDNPQEGGSYNIPLGDVLCLSGSVLFGVANVAQEFLVKNHSIVEYLALLGLSAAVYSGIQLSILERESLVSVDWSNFEIGLYLAGFVLALFAMYVLIPVLIRRTSATFFNLSVLTADFYSLLFGLFLFKYSFSWLYFVAFCLTIVGLVIYSLKNTSQNQHNICYYVRIRLKACFVS